MVWIYKIGLVFYRLALIIASLFNPKAKLMLTGRKNIFLKISRAVDPKDRPVWFHFASLGEFEQGRPVLEGIKKRNPAQKVLITFFSPSGYEIRKNYPGADAIFYLPLDSQKNAERFINLVNPSYAVFTKYEFWHFYFAELKRNNMPLLLISAIFRPNQLFFKGYGTFYRDMLRHIDHIFVQNEESKILLEHIGINQVSLGGDTRFDRVFENAEKVQTLPIISKFKGQCKVLIAGSTWLKDEELLRSFQIGFPEWKIIIAPHEVSSHRIAEVEKIFPNAIKFSTYKESAQEASILIIDNIGMLSALYQYGDIAYIGGGFGVGIHNTLEAAAFGLPLIFGPNYAKFQEAKDLISLGVAKSVSNEIELQRAFESLDSDPLASARARNYVLEKKGATDLILNFLNSKGLIKT